MQQLKKFGLIVGYSFLLVFLYLSPAITFLVGLDFLSDSLVEFASVGIIKDLIGAVAVVYSVRFSLEV